MAYFRKRGSRYGYRRRGRYQYRKPRPEQGYYNAGSGTIPRRLATKSALSPVHKVSRVVEYGQQNINVGDTLLSYSFKLSDLPAYTDYTNAFDQYRIVAIRFDMCMSWALSGTETSPFIYSCIDTDDATVPANKGVVLQHETCRFHGCVNADNNHKITRWIKPQVSTAVYGSGLFNSYAQRSNAWINSASYSVEHYGIKIAFTSLDPVETNAKFIPVATYYLELKQSV